MLGFLPFSDQAGAEGDLLSDGEDLVLYPSLKAARRTGTARVYVVDLNGFPNDNGGDTIISRAIPRAAIRNIDPYRTPKPVTAAGGYVIRASPIGPQVVLIFRRSVWDLPKGKKDKGETVQACAIREVGEEIGATDLVIHRFAGTTVHGYPSRDLYYVKTTYWYTMSAGDTPFSPQQEEGIEEVRWFAWDEAIEVLGYETLRAHAENIPITSLMSD